MEIKLRHYQSELITKTSNAIAEGERRIMIASPTGSGKSVVFAYIANAWHQAGRRVLIITHRKEILRQTFKYFSTEVESLTAETNRVPNGNIVLAMVETIFRRVENKEEYAGFIGQFNLVIIDEAHTGNFDKLFQFFEPNQVVLGFSATPFRNRNQTALSVHYNRLIQGIDVPDLVEMGYLAHPISYGQRVDLSGVRLSGNDYRDQDIGAEFERQQVYDGVIKNYRHNRIERHFFYAGHNQQTGSNTKNS